MGPFADPHWIQIMDPVADLTELLDLMNLDPKHRYSASDYSRSPNRRYKVLKLIFFSQDKKSAQLT
jgi:hypothetical protein